MKGLGGGFGLLTQGRWEPWRAVSRGRGAGLNFVPIPSHPGGLSHLPGQSSYLTSQHPSPSVSPTSPLTIQSWQCPCPAPSPKPQELFKGWGQGSILGMLLPLLGGLGSEPLSPPPSPPGTPRRAVKALCCTGFFHPTWEGCLHCLPLRGKQARRALKTH